MIVPLLFLSAVSGTLLDRRDFSINSDLVSIGLSMASAAGYSVPQSISDYGSYLTAHSSEVQSLASQLGLGDELKSLTGNGDAESTALTSEPSSASSSSASSTSSGAAPGNSLKQVGFSAVVVGGFLALL